MEARTTDLDAALNTLRAFGYVCEKNFVEDGIIGGKTRIAQSLHDGRIVYSYSGGFTISPIRRGVEIIHVTDLPSAFVCGLSIMDRKCPAYATFLEAARDIPRLQKRLARSRKRFADRVFSKPFRKVYSLCQNVKSLISSYMRTMTARRVLVTDTLSKNIISTMVIMTSMKRSTRILRVLSVRRDELIKKSR